MDSRKRLLAAPTVNEANRSGDLTEIYSSLSVPDMYIGWHSFQISVMLLKTQPNRIAAKLKDEVYKLKQKNLDVTFDVIKNVNDYGVDPTLSRNNATLHKTIQIIKKTKLVGFRDRVLFEIFPKDDETVVAEIYSRSIDQNVYTALCGCSPKHAYYACCCGFCPTYDFESNKKFVYSLLAAIDESYVFANSEEVQVAKKEAYKPPRLQSRDSFAWDLDTNDASNQQSDDISRDRGGQITPASEMTPKKTFSMENVNRTASNSPSYGYIKVKSQAKSNKINADGKESNLKVQIDHRSQENIQDDEDSAESGGSWYEL
eukprot:g2937.t1